MAELLNPEDRPMFMEALVQALTTLDVLKGWLGEHYAEALPQLGPGNLRDELTRLMTWAIGNDGMRAFLQRLADHPPNKDIAVFIFVLTHGEIKQRAATNDGLPPVEADRRWFAVDRPFVDRGPLREHLRQLATSAGAKAILVIDGEHRTGKSLTVSLLMGFDEAKNSPPPLDLDAYAKVGAELNARELAVEIAGDEVGCPSFDITKEDESVPRLMRWLVAKLRGKRAWIIIDHCNRRVLTEGAKRILQGLAVQLRTGALDIRLILIDFDRNDLPQDFRDQVRYDQAVLPTEDHVKQWCEDLATVANRDYQAADPAKWARDVFSNLAGLNQKDGSWHAELERQLRQAVDRVLACRERQ